MDTKYFTSKEISDEYNLLSCKEKNVILYDAIDIMNQYNGRTRFLCIAIAMGYENYEGDNVSFVKVSYNNK